jgi:hypothetical protein
MPCKQSDALEPKWNTSHARAASLVLERFDDAYSTKKSLQTRF